MRRFIGFISAMMKTISVGPFPTPLGGRTTYRTQKTTVMNIKLIPLAIVVPTQYCFEVTP